MSCSDGPAASAFLVDSLIGGRSEGAAAGGGAHYTGLCLPHGAAATEVAYGLHGYGYFPGVVGKRSESASQQILPNSTTTSTTSSTSSSGVYMSSMEMWMDAQRSCRMEEQQQQLPCSFPQSIKEENTYCLYEPPHCPKASTADELSYSRLSSAACTLNDGSSVGDGGSVPVPGYFRLSQTNAHAHKLYNSSNNSSNSGGGEGGGGGGGDGCSSSSSSSPQPTPPHAHFGSHSSGASRFHTPPSSAQARDGRGGEDSVASAGTVKLQQKRPLQAATGSREQEKDSSDAEGSSADEAEELEKDRRAAAGLKGKASLHRCGCPWSR